MRCSSSLSMVFVALTEPLNQVQQNTTTRVVQWASSQLESTLSESTGAGLVTGPEARLSQTMLLSLSQHGTLTALGFSLTNTLAQICGCVRVSLGELVNEKLRLIAMSGQSSIDSRRTIARQLSALMLEASEHDTLVYPAEETPSSSVACQVYFKSQGQHPLLAFVLHGDKQRKFVLVLERNREHFFKPAQVEAIQASVQHIGPLLAMTALREQSPTTHIRHWVSEKLSSLLSVTGWTKFQLAGVTALLLLLSSLVIPLNHRVSADAYIEASDRQVLVAPQSGFILTSNARAGDEVREGDLLATLDGRDIQLEVDKWQSEKLKNQQAYAQALASHDRTELSRLRADAQRVDAEISLLQEQLDRSELRAPFSGVLMNGDLTQSLGAPVSAGDVLFEIASAEKYRLVVEVDEHDIAHIKPDQVAELRMAALPATVWQAELRDVLPVAVSEKGQSSFRVLANINGEAGALRPGMQGVAKVLIDQRSMFWVATHTLGEHLRYLAWKLGLI